VIVFWVVVVVVVVVVVIVFEAWSVTLSEGIG